MVNSALVSMGTTKVVLHGTSNGLGLGTYSPLYSLLLLLLLGHELTFGYPTAPTTQSSCSPIWMYKLTTLQNYPPSSRSHRIGSGRTRPSRSR